MVCGIYEIVHTKSGRKYIGQSGDIYRRWQQHRKMLGEDNHHSHGMLLLWRKEGPAAFEFRVIEQCATHELDAREQFYMNSSGRLFNRKPVQRQTSKAEYDYTMQPLAPDEPRYNCWSKDKSFGAGILGGFLGLFKGPQPVPMERKIAILRELQPYPIGKSNIEVDLWQHHAREVRVRHDYSLRDFAILIDDFAHAQLSYEADLRAWKEYYAYWHLPLPPIKNPAPPTLLSVSSLIKYYSDAEAELREMYPELRHEINYSGLEVVLGS
jgi:hypothetical protein